MKVSILGKYERMGCSNEPSHATVPLSPVRRRAGAPLTARFLLLFITEYTNSEQNIDVCLYLLKQRIGKV
jgi:hypothetical protein